MPYSPEIFRSVRIGVVVEAWANRRQYVVDENWVRGLAAAVPRTVRRGMFRVDEQWSTGEE